MVMAVLMHLVEEVDVLVAVEGELTVVVVVLRQLAQMVRKR